MRPTQLAAALLLVLALPPSAARPAHAVTHGDILVTDQAYGLFFDEFANGNIHHVGPPIAAYTQGLGSVASDGSGAIYATLAYAGAVYRVDAGSGDYITVATAGLMQYPNSIALLPGGGILVGDGSAGVIAIDPTSGAQTGVLTGLPAWGVTAGGSGIVHAVLSVTGGAFIFRIDPANGDTVRVSSTPVATPCQMATEASGDLILTQPASGRVERILVSAGGAVQTLAAGGLLHQPYGVTVALDGTIVVSDTQVSPSCGLPGGGAGCYGFLWRVDPGSGTVTMLWQGTPWNLEGIDVYRGPDALTPVRPVTWGSLKAGYR